MVVLSTLGTLSGFVDLFTCGGGNCEGGTDSGLTGVANAVVGSKDGEDTPAWLIGFKGASDKPLLDVGEVDRRSIFGAALPESG